MRPLLNRAETCDAARQLIRASASAADHHRSAGRARSHAEFIAKIGVAVDEADEARSWLDYLRRTGFVDASELPPYYGEAQELVAILNKSYETARKRRSKGRNQKRNPPQEDRSPSNDRGDTSPPTSGE